MFETGEAVLCIRSGWGQMKDNEFVDWCPNRPRRGRLYTIRACWQTSNGMWWVYLCELVNPPNPVSGGTCEPYFMAEQFVRPEKRATDISIFTEALTKYTREKA